MMTKRTIIGSALLTTIGSIVLLGSALSQEDPRLQRDRQLVRTVQQALLDKGYPAGPVDGIVGPQTREALRRFQEDENLDASGRMSDETLRHLGVEAPARSQDDSRAGGGVVGAVGSGAKTAGEATATGATAVGRGTAKGATVVAKSTASGATVAAKGTAKGAKTAAKGTAVGADATAQGATAGAKAVAGGVGTGAQATAGGARSAARGTKNFLFGKGDDDKIRDRVVKAFKNDPVIDPSHFDVRVDDRVVTLRFKKGTSQEWNRAVVVARRVEGVERVLVRRPQN